MRYKSIFSIRFEATISCTYPSCSGYTSAQTSLVPGLGSNDLGRFRELGEDGTWVVGVTARAWGVEGGTLIPIQRDGVLDAQWQIRLISNDSQGSV